MLIASQFMLWVVAALLVIAVLALARQIRSLDERLAQAAVCARCGDETTAVAPAETDPRPAQLAEARIRRRG